MYMYMYIYKTEGPQKYLSLHTPAKTLFRPHVHVGRVIDPSYKPHLNKLSGPTVPKYWTPRATLVLRKEIRMIIVEPIKPWCWYFLLCRRRDRSQ